MPNYEIIENLTHITNILAQMYSEKMNILSNFLIKWDLNLDKTFYTLLNSSNSLGMNNAG